MMRIQELSPGQIDNLKHLGRDTLMAISPPVASLVYSNGPDQLQALQRIGPDALGAMSPKLADMLYGDDGYGGSAIGDYGNHGYGGSAVGTYGKKKRIPPIIVPPFPIPPDQEPPDEYKPDPGDIVSWWCFADACPVCQDNAADPPRPYGTPFSSGDTEPPAHNECRCGLVTGIRGYCPIHGYSRYDNRIFELSSRF